MRSLILGALGVAAAMSAGTVSAATITLTGVTGTPGGNVTSSFTLNDYGSISLSSLTIGVTFDDSVLQYVGASLGGVLDNTNEFFDVTDNGGGNLVVQFSDTEGVALPAAPPAGPQTLFDLTFQLLPSALDGETRVDIVGGLTPLEGDVITFSSIDEPATAGFGSVTVVPLPAAGWLLATGLAALLPGRRRAST